MGLRERNGVRGWYTPLRSIVKVTQTGEAVGDEQMMLELGKKMNPDLFYWDDVPEMLEFCTNNMATVPVQITFSVLREKVIVYPEFEYYKYKTGKLRFDGNPGLQHAVPGAWSASATCTTTWAWSRCRTSRSRRRAP